MNDIIHELEAVVAERDALLQHLDELAAIANKWASAYAEKEAEIERLNEQVRVEVMHREAMHDQREEYFKQLAAGQAREQKLREALNQGYGWVPFGSTTKQIICFVLALPTDTTALQSMIAKAGEVMRKRALVPCDDLSKNDGNSTECRAAAGLCGIAIDALPAITLGDLKGGAA